MDTLELTNLGLLTLWSWPSGRGNDPEASKSRSLVSLMCRHRHNLKPEQNLMLFAYLDEQPVLKLIYRFK